MHTEFVQDMVVVVDRGKNGRVLHGMNNMRYVAVVVRVLPPPCMYTHTSNVSNGMSVLLACMPMERVKTRTCVQCQCSHAVLQEQQQQHQSVCPPSSSSSTFSSTNQADATHK